jgi:hypothetical protein
LQILQDERDWTGKFKFPDCESVFLVKPEDRSEDERPGPTAIAVIERMYERPAFCAAGSAAFEDCKHIFGKSSARYCSASEGAASRAGAQL